MSACIQYVRRCYAAADRELRINRGNPTKVMPHARGGGAREKAPQHFCTRDPCAVGTPVAAVAEGGSMKLFGNMKCSRISIYKLYIDTYRALYIYIKTSVHHSRHRFQRANREHFAIIAIVHGFPSNASHFFFMYTFLGLDTVR